MSDKGKNLIPGLRFPEFRDIEGWGVEPLDSIALFYKGKGISKSDIDPLGGVPCIRYGELYTIYGEVIDRIFSRTNLPLPELFLSQSNDVVIPSSGETKIDIAKASCVLLNGVALGGDLNVLRSTNANGIFLSYLLNGPCKAGIARKAQGVTVVHLYASQLKLLNVPIPKLPEQQKIADCLSSVDELIIAERKRLSSLKNYKKGLMQDLFPTEDEVTPKLRFSDFKNTAPWKKIKLIDVADKAKKWCFIGGPFGSNLKASDYVEDGVRVIQLQNIGDGRFINNYQIFTSEEKANELLSNNIYPGEIILSKMGDPVGRACLIPDTHSRYVMCSDGIRLVVDEQNHSKYFIYSLINSSQFRTLVEKTATGSTRKRIGLDDLKNLPMLVPAKNEQEKIANCLSSIDEIIAQQDKKIRMLKGHKKSLMQQLFPITDGVGL